MSQIERFYVTMPEEIPTANHCSRVAPNEGHFPLDATVSVFTEEHLLKFKFFPKGPAQKDYLVSLVDAEPPLTQTPMHDKEVYVVGDMIVEGREFRLASALPIIKKISFQALYICANIEQIDIPLTDE